MEIASRDGSLIKIKIVFNKGKDSLKFKFINNLIISDSPS